MRQIGSLRREAHCTYRAMRRLLFGGEQKETAMPFPTSKCGRPGESRFVPGGVVPVDERTRICGERSTTPDRRNSRLSLGAWCSSTREQGFAGREAPRRTGGRDIRVALPVRTGPEPRRSAAGWHQKAELLQQLRDIIILSDENRDLISENPSRIGLVRELHEGVLCGIVGDGLV